jgi:hypothetical protein
MDNNTLHHFSDGLYAKQMDIPKGSIACQHKHEYNHLSVLGKGKVRVLFDNDVTEVFEAPACINIKKGINHTILALEDSTWFCIHHTFETDMNKIDNVLIKQMKEES